MYLAQKGIIPSKQWQHYPYTKDINKWTVAHYLASNGIIPPKQWNVDPLTKTQKGNTVAMFLARQNIIPPQRYCHKPQLYYQEYNGTTELKVKSTVALLLAFYGTIPPKEWQHDKYLTNINNQTVEDLLQQNNIEVPEYWKCSNNKQLSSDMQNIVQKYQQIYNIDNQMQFYASKIQKIRDFNYYINLFNNQSILQYYNYKKSIQDSDGNTLAHLLAKNAIIPPQECYFSELKLNKQKNSVAMLLAQQGIIPPQQWDHDPILQNKQGYTVALYLAQNGIIPPKQWEHDSSIVDENGQSVAFKLAQCQIIPPQEWKLDTSIKYKYYINNEYIERTVALQLAAEGIIPNSWEHDPKIKDNLNYTVKDYLSLNNIKIPQFWDYNKYNYFNTLRMYQRFNINEQ